MNNYDRARELWIKERTTVIPEVLMSIAESAERSGPPVSATLSARGLLNFKDLKLAQQIVKALK